MDTVDTVTIVGSTWPSIPVHPARHRSGPAIIIDNVPGCSNLPKPGLPARVLVTIFPFMEDRRTTTGHPKPHALNRCSYLPENVVHSIAGPETGFLQPGFRKTGLKNNGMPEEISSDISILITGASGGIGYSTAVACASRGARIGIHCHENRKTAEHLAGELDGTGHCVLQADLTDPDATQNLALQADHELGGVDVLVNNAGIARRQQIDAISYQTWQATWERIVDTNLIGPANLSFCVSKRMLERGGGRIVNVSSRGAFRGEPMMPWYGASKAGMNAMGQSMAQALAPRNIFVFTVAPGFVETEMAREILASAEGENLRNQSSLGRVARPEEVARTIEFLAFDAPAFMTGCIIDVNGASYLRS